MNKIPDRLGTGFPDAGNDIPGRWGHDSQQPGIFHECSLMFLVDCSPSHFQTWLTGLGKLRETA